MTERMTDEVKPLVAHGYDIVAEVYLERYGRSRVRDRWLGELVALLPERARVLDLGCGAGVPIALELAACGFEVVGLDVSTEGLDRRKIR